MPIFSEPDLRSVDEAVTFLKTLKGILEYADISDCKMEQGSLRCDANISLRKVGDDKLNTRVELKNINSFKFIGDAIEYEIQRHIEQLESGKKIKQETRLWDAKNRTTIPMRSKEEAADYRYFHDPDLPLIEVNEEIISRIQKMVPELPHEKFTRFCKEKGLTPYESEIIVSNMELANYFEKTYELNPSKQIINWILRDLLGYLKEQKISLIEFVKNRP